MKKMMSLFIVLNLFVGSALAEDKKTTDANNKVSAAEAMEAKCKAELDARTAKNADGEVGQVPAQASSCDFLYVAAKVSEAEIQNSDSTASADGAVTCVQKFGYTVDYQACQKSVKLYNYVLVTEKAMQLQQAARQTISNNKISNDVQKKTAEGDGQDAAWSATIKTNQNLANMNKEQAAVYAASVSALSSGISSWPGPNAAGYRRVCNSSATVFAKLKADKRLHPEVVNPNKCVDVIANAKATSKAAVFANENAKAILGSKMIEFVQKGIAAGINAAKLGQNADRMKTAQEQYEDADMMLDKCVVSPTSAECMAPIERGTVEAYQGGSFNLGAGTNTDNAFNNGGEDTFGIDGNPTTAGTGNITDIKSPFEDQAKVAKGILDPANAATITPGGGGAAGSGGGGGGGGGGSASLGDDIKGADASGNKEAEIKSSKFSGAYGANGGGGFQAIKGSGKDDEANPLAGLVDGNGGIEEDRSIASEGIDGQDSGLFQKISNKYSQIQNEKRIEANNLE